MKKRTNETESLDKSTKKQKLAEGKKKEGQKIKEINSKKEKAIQKAFIGKKPLVDNDVSKPLKKEQKVKEAMKSKKLKSVPQAEDKVDTIPALLEKKMKLKAKATQLSDKIAKKKALFKQKLENRKEGRKEHGQFNVNLIKFTPDELRTKIKEIEDKGELSKTGKRRLRVLKKKLWIEEHKDTPKPVKTTEKKTVLPKLTPEQMQAMSPVERKRYLRRMKKSQKNSDNQNDSLSAESPKSKVNEKMSKTDSNEGTQLPKKTKTNSGKLAKAEKVRNVPKVQLDSDDDNEEDNDDLNETAEASSDENDDDVAEDQSDEEEMDVDNESEDDEEEEDADSDEVKPVKKAGQKPAKKSKGEMESQNNVNTTEEKKTRYVLYVGNLPYTITTVDIKKHFLTKVGHVVDVRIPKSDTDTPRGFAYVEFSNKNDYEKGLSLHNSIVAGRKINVQYTMAGSKKDGKKGDIISKNKKLHALRKDGKLTGSMKDKNKRNFRRNNKPKQGNKE